MYSLFRGETNEDDLFEYLEDNQSYTEVEVDYHFAIFEFDVSVEHLDSVFVRMARQLEMGIDSVQIEIGRDRLYDEQIYEDIPAIDKLTWIMTGDYPLSYDVQDSAVTEMFQAMIGSDRLALVLVSSEADAEQALEAVVELQKIPRNECVQKAQAIDEDLLKGELTWPNGGSWALGIRTLATDEMSPAEIQYYYAALSSYLNDVVSLRNGNAYGIEVNRYFGIGEVIMLFTPYIDDAIVDYESLEKEIKSTAAGLADPSSVGFWNAFADQCSAQDSLYGINADDASTVADYIAVLVSWARMEGHDQIDDFHLPSGEQARQGFAKMLDKSVWFVVQEDGGSRIERLSKWLGGVFSYIYGGLFGPDDRTRALAIMCQCLLVLMVLRRIDKRLQRE